MKLFRIICVFSACLFTCLVSSPAGDQGMPADWQGIRAAYDNFLKKPSSRHAKELANALPGSAVAPEELAGGEETIAYIFDGDKYRHFENIVKKAKPAYMRAALKMTNITDSDHTGELEALLGSCVTKNTAGFLETVKDASDFQLRGILGDFSGSPENDSDSRIEELKSSRAAIEKIKKKKYAGIKGKCLEIIKIFIEEQESMKIQGE